MREVLAKEIAKAKRGKALSTDKSMRDTLTRLSRAIQAMRSIDPVDNSLEEGYALMKSILTTDTSISEQEAKRDDRQQRADLDRVSAWLNDNALITSDSARDIFNSLQVS